MPAGYAGQDACLGCHQDYTRGYTDSGHGRAMNVRTPAAQRGCESCHGPGEQHANDPSAPGAIRVFRTSPVDVVNETCLTCHTRDAHALWDGSAHALRDLSCSTCHSVHDPASPAAQLRAATETQLCSTCHRPQSMKVLRTSHMPLRDGFMQCSTCHNPHGTVNVRLLREGHSIAESCVTCHAAQRGPFLWEHAVGRDDCTVCHDPHGSSNDRMLVAKQPMLCQRCHIHTRHPSVPYDQSFIGMAAQNRLINRSCVNCHQNVHGSNHPSGMFFLR